MIPVGLNDSLSVDLVFDTGVPLGYLSIDSSFCAEHPLDTWKGGPDVIAEMVDVGWTYDKSSCSVYLNPLELTVCGDRMKYGYCVVKNWKKIMSNAANNGLFNIPANDTTHVWELNFEHDYLEIHPAAGFVLPEECFLLPFAEGQRDSSLYVRIPLKVTCADGDTLTIDRTFLIDTGMPWDVVLMHPAEELGFFEEKEAVYTGYGNGSYRRYTVDAGMFGNFAMDSLRIYTFDDPLMVGTQYLIGQNFLRRFNVFFDMRNGRLGLQPIRNFRRVVNPNHRRIHLWVRPDTDGRFIVVKIADYAENRYKQAGLREGDEVVAVNGYRYERGKGLSDENAAVIFKQDTKVFDIVRDGKPLRITVTENPNEDQGD
nr:tight junction protein ZO-3 [uncultured Alistipes sp.]